MTGPPSPDSADPDQPGAGRASAARQESEDPFRVMADCSPVIMWLTDMAGRVEYANRAYREFFALQPAQTISFDWGAQLHPDDAEAYRSMRAPGCGAPTDSGAGSSLAALPASIRAAGRSASPEPRPTLPRSTNRGRH
jgi:hypothetical protein